MHGLLAPLLKTAIKAYLKDRFGDRFTAEDYELLAEEFKVETTSEEFTALRKLDGDERRDLVRSIASRIQTRMKKSGTKHEKEMLRRFMKARAETSTTSGGKAKRPRRKS